jgi:TetR/AcrR family transcriptional repressor of lmrAB and yxaGH operons
LLHRQGYTSTGLNQVLNESNAPKGSMYFHFPGGKEELMAEALHLSAGSLTELLERLVEMAPTAEIALDQIVAYFANQLESSSYTKGCPVATVALEQAATSDALQRECSAARGWQALSAERDGVAAERADALAIFFLATIEGALLLCARMLDQVAAHRRQARLPHRRTVDESHVVTGATGLIGRWLVPELTRLGRDVALVRRADERRAEYLRWVTDHGGDAKRVTLVEGDLAAPDLGLDAEGRRLASTARDVFHAGALMQFGMTEQLARAANVHVTRALLELVASPALRRFVLVTGFKLRRRRVSRARPDPDGRTSPRGTIASTGSSAATWRASSPTTSSATSRARAASSRFIPLP